MSYVRVREQSALLLFFNDSFEVCECAKRIGRVSVAVVKPLQDRTKNGIFGHPTWDAISLVSPNSRFLNNHTYSGVVTRYGPLHQYLRKALSILDSVRITPLIEESLLVKSGWAISRTWGNKE